jgi:spore maturation protein CgeB
LSTHEFNSLIASCDVVVAFTRFEGIQMSVCGEAVGAGKPMLISDTTTLRRMFPAGSVFVPSDNPSEIALGAKQLLARLPELREAARAQQREILAQWTEQRRQNLMDAVSNSLNEKQKAD